MFFRCAPAIESIDRREQYNLYNVPTCYGFKEPKEHGLLLLNEQLFIHVLSSRIHSLSMSGCWEKMKGRQSLPRRIVCKHQTNCTLFSCVKRPLWSDDLPVYRYIWLIGIIFKSVSVAQAKLKCCCWRLITCHERTNDRLIFYETNSESSWDCLLQL